MSSTVDPYHNALVTTPGMATKTEDRNQHLELRTTLVRCSYYLDYPI